MSIDEDDGRPATPGGPLKQDLSKLSVVELEAYIAELEAEIARVRAAIRAKSDVRAAAEALFKKPS
ncbi:MAG: DUF1192 domain-containing protein [Geminicoccaceae bacterium]